MRITRKSGFAAAGLVVVSALTLAGCSSSSSEPAASESADGLTIGSVDLAAAGCPADIRIQTDWNPESEHGHLYQLLGDDYTIDPNDLLIVKGIALRIAAQWFTNPEDRAQYAGPEGLSYTASPQMLSRIMGEADRRTLTSVQLRYAPGFA